jgi:hypothetical protein
MAYAVKQQFKGKMVKMEKRNGQPLFKVKWLCAANCIAAGHLHGTRVLLLSGGQGKGSGRPTPVV